MYWDPARGNRLVRGKMNRIERHGAGSSRPFIDRLTDRLIDRVVDHEDSLAHLRSIEAQQSGINPPQRIAETPAAACLGDRA